MIYQYVCENCNEVFCVDLSISDREVPIGEKCPKCSTKGKVRRDYSGISFVYDTVSVHKRAERKMGSRWGEVLRGIHKSAGSHSKMEI